MKLFETTEDQKTVRLGIVKLGTAVGKVSIHEMIANLTRFNYVTEKYRCFLVIDKVCIN